MPRPIALPDTCNFSDDFKLNFYAEDILHHFGYQYRANDLEPPAANVALPNLQPLRDRLRRHIPRITLDNEISRREFLIAPVLTELLDLTAAKIKTAYPIDVAPQLRGSLDYFIEADDRLLVIEAKDENLERGFKQLAVELIAVERQQYAPEMDLESDAETDSESDGEMAARDRWLWGAVSIGKIWQFARLDRREQAIVQDLNLYRVPADLEPLLQLLVGILNAGSQPTPPANIPTG